MFIEKRNKLRFPLDCEISFQAGPHHGAGRLVDVSSNAVAFRTETDLPDATLVQVSIPWPVRLGDCPLKLVALGRVMNKRGEVVVISIDLHEFRTRGKPVESPPLLALRSIGKTRPRTRAAPAARMPAKAGPRPRTG